jgi:class 3 adenylate cyclase/predicted ATPase
MRCPSCGFENPEGLKFCNECGTTLKRHCTQCGFENAPQSKFCGECGTALSAAGKPPPAKSRRGNGAQKQKRATRSVRQPATAPPRPASPEAERRQLTVMFCDLVGSTSLSEQLDPEELRAVMQAYQRACVAVITHFDGHVAKYLGDGLLVYFGYPVAHEDDAPRAVRTGLGIVEAIQALPLDNARLSHPLQVRIGIHTGLVVAGEMGSGEYREQLAIVGETPNIAARLQEKAEPNSVVISPATQQLVTGLFECQDLGLQTLKGISAPLSVYRVVRESEVQSRFEAAVRRGLTPLVGREEELGLLRRQWAQAQAGAGQIVLLNGEPGIGKSRLLQEFKEQLAPAGVTRIEFRCSPYHQNSAFYPLIDHLHRLLQFAPHDTPQARLAILQQTLVRYRFPQADTLPLLAALLSLPHPESAPPLTLSPQKQKQKTQEALVTWVVEEAERAPVYCAWEDLHWADPSTLEVLTLFLDQVPTTRLLALLTFRPEFTPPWGNRSHLSQLTLSRLGRSQVEALVEKVTSGKALPPEVVQQIVAKTDGVPLFIEELTKTVVESGLLREEEGRYVGAHGGAPIPPLAIPSTLHDSLMARLDRLSTVREIAQLGATLGREFSYELLHAVSPLDEETLQHGLKQLVEAELLYQRGLGPLAQYLFKHALIQDTAYQSLLKSKRQQLHQQIVRVLEERLPDTKETQPELLAHHYTEAGLMGQALPYWQQAGQKASQRSANIEAIAHLSKGLELLKTLPDTPQRVQQELALQLTLGVPLQMLKGEPAPEVGHTYHRILELCGQVEDTAHRFPALFGLWRFYLLRADLQKAGELAKQMVRLTQSSHDPSLLLEAHRALGTSLFFLGELRQGQRLLEQGIGLYDIHKHRSHAFRYGIDPGVYCLCLAAWDLWCLGYPEQALKNMQDALRLAHELAHPHTLVFALLIAAYCSQFRYEATAVREQAEALLTLSAEQGFAFRAMPATIMRGWALAAAGQLEEGIGRMQEGLAEVWATATEVVAPYWLALLAETYGKMGQSEEGLATLAEASALVRRSGEQWYEAELYRLKGTLTLQSPVQGPKSQVEEAEACFLKAIEIARRQQAKSLELRAVMSLSRLWQSQDKKKEAHTLLSDIYLWFTEGFDTKDLQEAKALMAELTEGQ